MYPAGFVSFLGFMKGGRLSGLAMYGCHGVDWIRNAPESKYTSPLAASIIGFVIEK
jgi:hypothetical protein